MIYFSELRRKKVQTEDEVIIGYLDDLVFLALETPRISKIVVYDNNKNKIYIPIENVVRINNKLTISKNYLTTEIKINELFIIRNLLDKQIIDLKGNKVVRVNDVVINDKPNYYVAGVDIGILGILRRLGLEQLFYKLTNYFFIKYNSQFLSWADIQPLELSRGKIVLNLPQEKLNNLHPADLADYLEKTNIKNISKILNLLDQKLATKVISELNPNFQLSLLRRLDEKKTETLLAHMDTDEVSDLLSQFSPKKRQYYLAKLEPKKRHEIERLFKLSHTSIGRYFSSEFVTVKPENTATQVIDKIKKETVDMMTVEYIYVVNDKNELVGVFNLHELLLQSLDTPVFKFMTPNLFIAHVNSPIMTVTRKLIKYHLNALPIVDPNKAIIGIIRGEDIAEYFLPQI